MKPIMLLPLVIAALTACATITPVPYTADPQRITDPRAEIKALIEANTVQGCVAEPEVSETIVVVKFVCSGGGIGNTVARLDRVKTIGLEESGGWYRVLVKHTSGEEDFAWTSRSLEDMRRLADAMTALSSSVGAGAETSPPQGSSL